MFCRDGVLEFTLWPTTRVTGSEPPLYGVEDSLNHSRSPPGARYYAQKAGHSRLNSTFNQVRGTALTAHCIGPFPCIAARAHGPMNADVTSLT